VKVTLGIESYQFYLPKVPMLIQKAKPTPKYIMKRA